MSWIKHDPGRISRGGSDAIVSRELFVPPFLEDSGGTPTYPWTGVHAGTFPVASLSGVQNITLAFHCPKGWVSTIEFVAVVWPDATETLDWDCSGSVAAVGEAPSTTNFNNNSLSVTANQLTELDCAGAIAGMAANDYVSVLFESDDDTIFLVGMRWRYRERLLLT